MKSILKNLFFDEEVVVKIKKTKMNREVLCNHLFNGRITLQEYLAVSK